MTKEEIKIHVEKKLAEAKKRTKICNCCGVKVQELMTSTNGSVCPDCYDICSD